MTRRILFCDGWEFSKQKIGTDYSDSFDWEKVDIPHDWLIHNTNDLYETSRGWYRKTFTAPDPIQGKRTFLRFEGVYMDCRVYVNGTQAFEWKYGYSTFEFEITKLLREGENLLTVSVDHREPNSRWYSGAGIFRSVWLVEKPQVNIVSDSLYVSTSKTGGSSWKLTVSAEFDGDTGGMSALLKIYHKEELILEKTADCDLAVSGCEMDIEDPPVWDITSPELCRAELLLVKDGETCDREETVFGFRTAEFTADRGFFLNGRHLKIHGCCEHHDLGALGAAINRSALEFRLDKLREMGINAIRTSHNMPSVELMELADEKGFLILSEGFDMWVTPKTEFDYARFFRDWVDRDVASWIRRDRNHPSVIGWSIGNEIYDTHQPVGLEITKLLYSLVRKHDSRCNACVTIGSNYMQWENAQKCSDLLKVAGYNYAERLYNEHHKKYPDWAIYGSETSSVVHSRGIYHFPLSMPVLTNDDEQCSSLGNCTTGWAAKNTEACIIDDRDADFCAGQFIWTGFDYIGEPTPYHTKNSYFGQIDTAGFEKDSFYIFKAEWTDYKKDPFVHLFPYWSFNEGEMIDVRICSNAPRVELFLDGASQGAFDIDHKHGKQLLADYRIPYHDGTLEAVAYDESGAVIARDVKKTFGDAAVLRIKTNRSVVKANGEDVFYAEIWAEDENGVPVENANNRVFVDVEGPARLMGLDNGDSTDYEQYRCRNRKLFSGKLMAVIASCTEAGEIRISACSKGLTAAQTTVTSLPAPVRKGISCDYRVPPSDMSKKDEVPVRTIKLSADCKELSPERPQARVSMKLLPADHTVSDIDVAVMTFRNIPSPIADCRLENGDVIVTAKGNGDFRLRAMCKNNDSRYHVISELTFSSGGFEVTCFDPYEFVTGGLFTKASDGVGNGIEKGVEFPGGKLCSAGFENVDFGDFGSDSVTLPVFANTLDPVYISFYDGDPDSGGRYLGKYEYHKRPVWLTYQEETFRLPERLHGIHDLYIASEYGIQVKGFRFERQLKEFSLIPADQADNVYGDRFTKGNGEITGITNNVCIEFGEFDFSGRKPESLTVCARTPLPVNSIHLQLDNGTPTRVLCEFARSDEYTEQTFSLPELDGRYNVSLIFLPGSDLDLKWIKFN